MELSARKKQILKRVIEDYIASAEPVGSKAIAQEMGGSVSSATVRNELAELGFVVKDTKDGATWKLCK